MSSQDEIEMIVWVSVDHSLKLDSYIVEKGYQGDGNQEGAAGLTSFWKGRKNAERPSHHLA